MLQFSGIQLGALAFLIIGLFHPLVIKGEYYFGSRIWIAFFAAGIIACACSLMVESVFWSALLGVFGFSSFWGIKEVFEQERRVKDGRFPLNPKRRQ